MIFVGDILAIVDIVDDSVIVVIVGKHIDFTEESEAISLSHTADIVGIKAHGARRQRIRIRVADTHVEVGPFLFEVHPELAPNPGRLPRTLGEADFRIMCFLAGCPDLRQILGRERSVLPKKVLPGVLPRVSSELQRSVLVQGGGGKSWL